MKKQLALLVVVLIAAVIANGQTLFTYGKKQVSKEEFLKAFNKNPNTAADKKAALKEYLDLYINFKLKVQAAYDSGLHNDQTYLYETANFRRQLAENFINEEAKINTLTAEAFQRAQKDIHLTQLFIEVPKGADETAAFKKAQQAYNDIKAGKPFEKAVTEYSSDANGSDLGWITVFTLPYEFETAVYDLKAGGSSEPVRSAYGYHIFKNTAERPALGRRKVAQILIAIPQNATAEEKTAAKEKADSVYQLITVKKLKWDDMVKLFSNDMSTAYNNGQLQEFGIGQYSSSFENTAFALKEPGEISKPFATNYGYHILQLVEVIPVAKDINDAMAAAAIKERVEKDDRLSFARKNLIDSWLKKSNYKAATFDNTELWQYVDSFANGKKTTGFKKIKDSTLIFSYAKQKVKANDLARFYRAAKTAKMYEGLTNEAIFKEYIKATVTEYYRDHLEDYNADFASQVREFNEANLLFAIMDKMVWGKAGTDEDGLKKYYQQHKTKYQWLPSADAVIITSTDETIIAALQQKLAANPKSWRTITESYSNNVVADSSRYELGQIPVTDRTNFQDGTITAPVKNTDGSTTFAYLFKVYRQQEPRNFEDARGLVINDYQTVLEEKWLAVLKKKYPVKVNKVVFDGIK